VVEARAAVLAGHDRPQVALGGDFRDQVEVETAAAVVLPRPRDDLRVGERARRLADQALLVGEVEVHRRTLGTRPTLRRLDTFSLIVAGGLAALVVVFLLIGFFYPGSGADVLDWKPTRSPELEAENEIDDVAQMIAAQNEMRRRRGAPERTEAQVKAAVEADKADLAARAGRYAEERRGSGRPMDKRDI